MLLSRANLSVIEAASKNAKDEHFNGVYVDVDGATAASNGAVVLAVGPASNADTVGFPQRAGDAYAVGDRGLFLPLELVGKVLSALGKDRTRPDMQHALISRLKDERWVGLTYTGLRGEPNTHSAIPKRQLFPRWRKVFAAFRKAKRKRICVNRKHLLNALKALEAVAPDKGGLNPLFIEIEENGKQMLLRCASYETGQRTIAMLNAFDTGEGWLKMDKWERSVFLGLGDGL